MVDEAVSNSTVLILLSKISRFDLLKNMFKKILITGAVEDELLNFDGNVSILLIKKNLNKLIFVLNPKKNLELDVGKGEKSAISLAVEKNLLFLSDDKKARKVCALYELKFSGTIGVLIWNLEKKRISKEDCLKILHELIDKGFYLSTDLYAEIIEFIENFS